MALFENETMDEEANIYFDDPKKGIELINKMILRRGKNTIFESEQLIFKKVYQVLAELNLENELEIYKTLVNISGKMKELQKIKLLEGKKVLGIGGQFSAGKSCFINSITNTNTRLPEGQRPTTSIATYTINADAQKNLAITFNDSMIELDAQAINAITYQFSEQYQIGFSYLIKSLVVYTPDFSYPGIAILDTPGYSKPDSSKKVCNRDWGMAKEQLNTVDYLIWLVDVENGGINDKDLEFISSLDVKSEILVVFTKASVKPKSELNEIVQHAKDTLASRSNKKIYDVIAYDSKLKETFIGNDSLEQYLKMISEANEDSWDIEGQIQRIRDQLLIQLGTQSKMIQAEIKKLETILIRTSNIEHIAAIVKEYNKCKSAQEILNKNKQKVINVFGELISVISMMKRGIK